MKKRVTLIFLIFLFLPAINQVNTFGQNSGMGRIEKHNRQSERDAQQSKSRKVKKAEAKAERKKEKERQAYERAKADDQKHRMELQSPQTKKRMKENKKNADKYNDKYHVPFLKRLFGKKQ